ncbi:MAG: type VI secretion system contractile sheath large subunit [Gemmatimonadaceae bacterium]
MTNPALQVDAPQSTELSADVAPPSTPQLERILGLINVDAPVARDPVAIDRLDDAMPAGVDNRGLRVAAALKVFLDAAAELDHPLERINKELLDHMLAQVDEQISLRLDDVMHHPSFQTLESNWRGLKLLVDRTDFRRNARVELLQVTKGELSQSFEDAPELIQSDLYERIYRRAYDQPGAFPYSSMISNFEFENTPQDIALLSSVSKVAAAAHCPFIAAIGPKFFGKPTMEEWRKVPDLKEYMKSVDFIKWNAFRDTEESRYVGLVFPRFLLRLPYGEETTPVKSFNYAEQVSAKDGANYLWGNATMAFAANLNRAFVENGWCVQIRGPESGGKVGNLPVHLYDVGHGKQMKIPTELLIDETLELACANHGFIALSMYENHDFACFFSANSAQRPIEYDTKEATANARINTRLPYIFLASRMAHFLKVMQRENIGATKDRVMIEGELNRWLKGLITETPNPPENVIAKHPLRAGQVTVQDIEGNPGFYRVGMSIMPHFQIEGMDITLSLVGKMPKGK